MPSNERLRTTKACVACSIRKIKCDGQDPCAHCIRFFDGECFYTTAKKRGPPKGCPPRGGHKKRQRNEAADNRTSPKPSGSGSSSAPHTQPQLAKAALASAVPSSSSPETSSSLPSHRYPGSAPFLPARSPLDSTLTPASAASMGNEFGDSILSGMGIPPVPMGMSRPVDSDAFNFDTPRIPMESTSRPSPLSVASAMSVPSCAASFAAQAGLASQGVDDLCLVYETFIHPHWPVIYLPALRSLRSLETQQPLVFDAILAVSAAHTAYSEGPTSPRGHFSSGTGRPMSEVCDELTESVRLRILGCMNSHDFVPSLQMVQSLIMISLVDTGSGRRSLGYQMSGFACRIAVDLGLHTHFSDHSRCARAQDSRTSQERSRTLWACFILDKIHAAVSQRPPLLRLVDIDAPRPSVMERDELDLWLSGAASQYFLQPHAREIMESTKSHCLSSFNAWCDVMAILEMILAQVYRPSTRRARMEGRHVDGYEDNVAQLDGELRKWRDSLPIHLQWSDEDPRAHDNTGLHRLTCRGFYYICIILLHRPQVPYLDTSENPDYDPMESQSFFRSRQSPDSYHLPNAVEAANHSATAICAIMESYENTFRMRKFASSWVFLVFQAATVHAGQAAHTPTLPPASNGLAPSRADSFRHLEQCIRWLDQIFKQWGSAGRHVEILRKLSALGVRTRPSSPHAHAIEGFDIGPFVPGLPGPDGPPFDPALGPDAQPFDPTDPMNEIPLDINAWMHALYRMIQS